MLDVDMVAAEMGPFSPNLLTLFSSVAGPQFVKVPNVPSPLSLEKFTGPLRRLRLGRYHVAKRSQAHLRSAGGGGASTEYLFFAQWLKSIA